MPNHQFTAEQQLLIDSAGNSFFEACPGAGKTAAIVERFYKLTSKKPRKGVALISFSRAAITEVENRCAENPECLKSPHFIGTIDAFINRFIVSPVFISEHNVVPSFIDCWENIGVSGFRLASPNHWAEFSLDWFETNGRGQAFFKPERVNGVINSDVVRDLASRNLQFLERKATVSINGLINGGHITSGESRQLMMRYLSENHINHILDLLTNRFNEVIVDESQDCGESEIALLREIKARGILVTMIGDLDQSIYEFRDATPTQFREFVSNSGFATTARLNINHRSTAHIVSVVSSLRTGRTQDSASAKNLALQTNPIYLLSYTNLDQILPTINSGRRGNLDLQSCIVLSHTGEDARICAGASNSGRVGNGRTIRLAFNSMILASQQSSSKDKLTAISTIERLLLGLVDGLDTASKSTDKIVDEFKLSRRWLRSAALFVALSTSPLANTRESYTVQLQAKINKLTWQEGIVLKSVTSYLRRPTEAQWSTLNIPSTVSEHVSLPFNTVHGVKGQEFEGVILIIPRNLHPDSSGMTVLDYWENDADSEAKRVLYVGASRAIKTLLLAIHGNHISRIINILSQTNVTFEVL